VQSDRRTVSDDSLAQQCVRLLLYKEVGMNFADQPKETRYAESAEITQRILRTISGKLPLEYQIQSTAGGGIDDISGHDCMVSTPSGTFSVQISIRPSYHFAYQDLLWERWEYPEMSERINGRSQNYEFDAWWHIVRLPDPADFSWDGTTDWIWYECSRRKLKDAVDRMDTAFYAGEMKTAAGMIKWVGQKPGDPAKLLYCLNPEKVCSRFQRISVR
jgi:hypothetical protein